MTVETILELIAVIIAAITLIFVIIPHIPDLRELYFNQLLKKRRFCGTQDQRSWVEKIAFGKKLTEKEIEYQSGVPVLGSGLAKVKPNFY